MANKHPHSGLRNTSHSEHMAKLLTAPELADRLGVGVESVRRWARDGRIPCLRPGERGHHRFRLDAVVAALETNASGSAGEVTT